MKTLPSLAVGNDVFIIYISRNKQPFEEKFISLLKVNIYKDLFFSEISRCFSFSFENVILQQ